jgi:carbon storage regulator CsrA
MLVLSREAGQSISIGWPCPTLVTVFKLLHKRKSVAFLVRRPSESVPAKFDDQEVVIDLKGVCQISPGVEMELIDLRGDKARIAIIAPNKTSVHRTEVYEAIRRETRRAGNAQQDADDEGLAGSPIPRPSSPKPPTLNIRLQEPGTE